MRGTVAPDLTPDMADAASPKAKPRWLLLGGLGFLGRNIVKYLVDNELASCVRVVDKRAPFMAFLSPDYKAVVLDAQPPGLVEWVQADVSDDDMLENAFFGAANAGAGSAPAAPGAPAPTWDFVINLVAETALGKRDEFYEKAVAGASKSGALAASLAASGALRKYVLVSTASVYKPGAAPSREDAPLAPWTTVAEQMLRVEEALRALGPALPLVVLRPALVYGPGDTNGLMPRCVVAATYTAPEPAQRERMEMLWDGDVKLATVHVFDVARAAVFAARKLPAGAVYNLADKGDSDAGKLTALVARAFGIEAGFAGSIKSNMAALRLDAVVDVTNENHLGQWLFLLKRHAIKNTPLSPFLHKQLIAHNHLAVDGSAIEGAGFKYAVAEPTLDLVRDPIAQHIAQGLFPPVLAQ